MKKFKILKDMVPCSGCAEASKVDCRGAILEFDKEIQKFCCPCRKRLSEIKLREERSEMLNQDYIYTGQTYNEVVEDLQRADYRRFFVEPAYEWDFELLKLSIKGINNVPYPAYNPSIATICGALITNTETEKAKERKGITLAEVIPLFLSGVTVYCERDGHCSEYNLRTCNHIELTLPMMQCGKWYTKTK